MQMSALRVRKESIGSTVFKNEAKLSIEYIPEFLPYRNVIVSQLLKWFKRMVVHPGKSCLRVLLHGYSGNGRTAVALKFGQLIEQEAVSKLRLNLKYVYINCIENPTLSQVLSRIAEIIDLQVTQRGNSINEMIQLIRKVLQERNMFVIICLDDADSFFSENTSTLNYLMKEGKGALNEDWRFSFVFVTRPDLVWSLPDGSFFKRYGLKIKFQPYTQNQLRKILEKRAEEAFRRGCISEEIIQMIAGLYQRSADVREALDLLWKAGQVADGEGSPGVSRKHVRLAFENLKPKLSFGMYLDLDPIKKIILFAILRVFERAAQDGVIKQQIWDEYKEICSEYDIEPKKMGGTLIELWIIELMTGFIKSEKGSSAEGVNELEELVHLTLSVEKLRRIVRFHLENERDWEKMESYFLPREVVSGNLGGSN